MQKSLTQSCVSDFLQASEDVHVMLADEEKDADQIYWYQPKFEHFNSFMTELENRTVIKRRHYIDDVDADYSISIAPEPDQRNPVFCGDRICPVKHYPPHL